ncbi:MAG: orotidine-5'-phosphate decarboxylase [Rhodospirillaceae bacterium]|nr:orotidine-5'-phosphate decarboxylase [Rhodospirillaceae bacterium]MYF85453.1 orotidine-5'-phosphate decarboxylase [Rhodospirillaceae bacterium]MYH39383.1 orotidine-5'-phosphate decarboxylase [Rhodospirillaceae bacterium]MYK13906.1 orotidine-5'-phosphate decarboxylase [Rhodospirillaceae bacterium]MYK59668.1 orotidine-5'-phosphate decarboxylase [Rhodospirillaceae bacterium]
MALDVPTAGEARAIVAGLGDTVRFYKIGLELMTGGDYFTLLDWLTAREKKVFADLKFFDIPATVAGAVRNLSGRGATFCTVHGNDAMMEAAVETADAAGDGLGILAVTVLTSLDRGDMDDLGFEAEIGRVVLSRAKRALALGCAGVVSSGLEVQALRAEVGDELIAVCPGIRPGLNRPADDQKRSVDIEQAFDLGADYLVIGRPIRSASDPAAAAEAIQQRIAAKFA